MMQKSVRRDLEGERVPIRDALLMPSGDRYLAHMVVGVRGGAADGECPKGMAPHQLFRTLVERAAIDRPIPGQFPTPPEG